jgi:hypothetical protein
VTVMSTAFENGGAGAVSRRSKMAAHNRLPKEPGTIDSSAGEAAPLPMRPPHCRCREARSARCGNKPRFTGNRSPFLRLAARASRNGTTKLEKPKTDVSSRAWPSKSHPIHPPPGREPWS